MFLNNLNQILSQIKPGDTVLDIGGWAQPFRRANFVMDAMPYESRGFYRKIGLPDHAGDGEEQFTKETWIQRDICSKEPYPFKDKSLDYVICSHVLEDIRDPLWVCSEMIRIGKKGYIETPSRILESIYSPDSKIVGCSHHRWLVTIEDNKIFFQMKYHSIHKKGLHLPSHTLVVLQPEQHVQWLFWVNSFEFDETHLPLSDEEIEENLKKFVNGNFFPVSFSHKFLWNGFQLFKKVMPQKLVIKLQGIGASYRRRKILQKP